MLAKRFFFVCVGVLCLAVVYHLGARSVRAQQGGQITAFWSEPQNCTASFVVGRTYYYGGLGGYTPYR